MNILVLCTGNSARSILLEAILNREGAAQGVAAFSAGSRPAGQVHPQSLALLKDRGFATASLRSKSWDEFAQPTNLPIPDTPKMDMVITVCGSAANEACPIWPGAPIRAHWGVDDPAAAADQPLAFAQTYHHLASRAHALLALPLATMARSQLGAALARIGTL